MNKLDMIIARARITADHHVLEIGCGWGAFAIRACTTTGCRVTGVTISKEQLTEAAARVKVCAGAGRSEGGGRQQGGRGAERGGTLTNGLAFDPPPPRYPPRAPVQGQIIREANGPKPSMFTPEFPKSQSFHPKSPVKSPLVPQILQSLPNPNPKPKPKPQSPGEWRNGSGLLRGAELSPDPSLEP